MKRLILAALVLTLTLPATATAGLESRPATQGPSAQCFDDTAAVLARQLPGDRDLSLPGCMPRSALTGKRAAAPSARLCGADDCAIYIWGKRGIGYQDIWTYPVRTVDFYGFRCYEALNSRPQGHPSTDAFGIYNGTGTMVRSPSMWLQWCTQNGLVRPGATVTCSGVATYPYFTTFSCTDPITAWFKPTRTVYGTWRWYKNGDYKATDHLRATIVASVPRDVLIMEWDW